MRHTLRQLSREKDELERELRDYEWRLDHEAMVPRAHTHTHTSGTTLLLYPRAHTLTCTYFSIYRKGINRAQQEKVAMTTEVTEVNEAERAS